MSRVSAPFLNVPDGPGPVAGAGARSATIARLRAAIRAIETRSMPHPRARPAHGPAAIDSLAPRPGTAVAPLLEPSPWRFGVGAIDQALPWGGLAPVGLHELRPTAYVDSWAALAFALALAGRQSQILDYPGQPSPSALPPPHSPARPDPFQDTCEGPAGRGSGVASPGPEDTTTQSCARRPLLWCATDRAMAEFGTPYGPGLVDFGLDPARLLYAVARTHQEALWAVEEGLRSGAVGLVLAQLGAMSFTAARRLALAAEAGGTPCLMLLDHGVAGSVVGLTRWRVSAVLSGPHPLEPRAPGARCWHIVLERCRHRAGGQCWTVEWCDDAYCFHLVAPVADRAAGPAPPRPLTLNG